MRIAARSFLLVTLVTFCACATTQGPPSPASFPSNDEKALEEVYAREWEWNLAESPELATEVGDVRFNDRLEDRAPEAIERRKAHVRALKEELSRFRPDTLSEVARLNFELFSRSVSESVEGQRFLRELLVLNQFSGPQRDLADVAENHPRLRAKDFADYLARLRAAPRYIAQTEALLRRGLEKGVMPAQVVLGYVGPTLEKYLVTDPAKSPLYSLVFAELPSFLSAEEQATLRAEAKKIVGGEVTPAFRRFAEFFQKEYLPKARAEVGWAALPDGVEWYAYLARQHTTTSLRPEEIHAIGLAEVARIRGEMEKVKAETGFSRPLPEFFGFLRNDPRFSFKDGAALLAGYRDIAKRVDPELIKQFGRLPRLPYGVTRVPPHAESGSPAAYYMPGSIEAGRSGMFYANTSEIGARPRWEMESLTLHETVPGHHLQIALAQESEALPKFRRYGHYTAFVEGWGLYAESLGKDLGLYKDPYSYFGRLVNEMWRAVRLVVDTGLHAKGWSRAQAIDFFTQNAGRASADIAVEVDRYIAWGGQALAYKIGELQLQALRKRAQEKLGKGFDARAFHDEVLSQGALPMGVLERRIDAWIEDQRRKQP